MVTFDTSEGTLTLPDSLVQAIVRHAERDADFTAAVFQAMGLDKSLRLPAAFVLEFAAVSQLWYWEWQGLRPHLPDHVPTFAEANKCLCDRAMKGPSEFAGLDAIPLSRQILQVWLENFAWDARDEFGVDLIVSQADEDQFVDTLAEFLWEHRNQLPHLLDDQETQP